MAAAILLVDDDNDRRDSVRNMLKANGPWSVEAVDCDNALYGKTFRRKTAVLARDDKDLHQATFFENVAHNRGFEVRAFTVFEDAVTWLWSTAGLTYGART